MHFSQNQTLTHGILIKRYKRFLCDVTLDTGEIITAHCPNPGAMLGLTTPGEEVFLSHSSSKMRKLAWTWEMVYAHHPIYGDVRSYDKTYIGLNTMHPNRLVRESFENGALRDVIPYHVLRAEVAYGNASRVDFILEKENAKQIYVEVKNVHLVRRKGHAEFPDCKTARGARHMQELGNVSAQGHEAYVIYVVQRSDVTHFSLAQDLDPFYCEQAVLAQKAGVKMLAFSCTLSLNSISLDKQLRVI